MTTTATISMPHPGHFGQTIAAAERMSSIGEDPVYVYDTPMGYIISATPPADPCDYASVAGGDVRIMEYSE